MGEPARPRPRHLDPDYGAQVEDEAVAAAYRHRPPYPERALAPLDWDAPLRALVQEFSTNHASARARIIWGRPVDA